MRKAILVVMAVFGVGLLGGPASLQEYQLGQRIASPYEAVEGWAKPFADDGFAFGGNSGVFAESPNRILVAQRGETRLPDPVPSGFEGFVGSIGINALSQPDLRTWQNCIYVLDGDGNVIEVWDQWDHLWEEGCAERWRGEQGGERKSGKTPPVLGLRGCCRAASTRMELRTARRPY